MEAPTPPAPPARLDPVHVEHTATLRIDAPFATAFELFTPEGERKWVPDWEPEYLHPRTGEVGPGTVFSTRNGGEHTVWMVLELDGKAGLARYVRMTPGSRLGTVTVRVRSASPTETDVSITYELTGLSEAGNLLLEALTDDAFSRTMDDWQAAIGEHLASSSPR